MFVLPDGHDYSSWRSKVKVFVTIPTYNERENIPELLEALLSLDRRLEVVVIDDDSPDGTASLVREMGLSEERIHLIHRKGNRGRGTAGIEGFRYALENGADAVIEMDADFSHHPSYIPSMIRELERNDLIIGSRYVSGGKEVGRSLARELITRFANIYTRSVLGLGVRDCTSGFRCYRRGVLEAIGVEGLRSKGPSIVEEVLYAAHLKGFRIGEIPIVFEDRKRGKSTLSASRLFKTAISILSFRIEMPRRMRDRPDAAIRRG